MKARFLSYDLSVTENLPLPPSKQLHQPLVYTLMYCARRLGGEPLAASYVAARISDRSEYFSGLKSYQTESSCYKGDDPVI